MNDRHTISAAEYQQRIVGLCLDRKGAGMPKKQRDRHILMYCVLLTLTAGRRYSEPEINEALIAWLDEMGGNLGVDHVMLRRYMVDEGFLSRDPEGSVYIVLDRAPFRVEASAEALDVPRLLADERRRRSRAHAEWRESAAREE